jgi:hypothetical protein
MLARDVEIADGIAGSVQDALPQLAEFAGERPSRPFCFS